MLIRVRRKDMVASIESKKPHGSCTCPVAYALLREIRLQGKGDEVPTSASVTQGEATFYYEGQDFVIVRVTLPAKAGLFVSRWDRGVFAKVRTLDNLLSPIEFKIKRPKRPASPASRPRAARS